MNLHYDPDLSPMLIPLGRSAGPSSVRNAASQPLRLRNRAAGGAGFFYSAATPANLSHLGDKSGADGG